MNEENKADTVFYKEFGDGRYVAVRPRLYNHIVLTGRTDDDYGYDTHWCYEKLSDAVFAADQWDGTGEEPKGWFRHADTGRRRPKGDPAKEYIER